MAGTFFAHPEPVVDDLTEESTELGGGLKPFTREDKRLCGFLYLRPNRRVAARSASSAVRCSTPSSVWKWSPPDSCARGPLPRVLVRERREPAYEIDPGPDRGRPGEALPLYQRALTIVEADYGPDHLVLATRLSDLAGALRDLDRMSEALPLYQRALAIAEVGYGPRTPDLSADTPSSCSL
jgi:Tetratricopeptide repeat